VTTPEPIARSPLARHDEPAPVPVPALVDGVNVDAVAAAVRACPGVSDLYPGRFAEVATYLPGRRVPGVVIADGTLTVQVRSRWAVPADALLREIDSAVANLRHGHQLRVVVADIDDPRAADHPGSSAPIPDRGAVVVPAEILDVDALTVTAKTTLGPPHQVDDDFLTDPSESEF
jgi:hypothetical protein